MRLAAHLLGPRAFLIAVLAVQAVAVAGYLAPDPAGRLGGPAAFAPGGYLFGDSGLYAAAADSLVRDRDLDLLNQCFPGKPTLAAALPDLEGEPGGEFGLSADGRLTLKQSPVLAVAGLPFLAALGLPGLLVFNLVALTVLLVGTARLAGDSPAARAVVLVGLVTTPLWRFAVNFSPDLFLSGLLVWSLVTARANRPGLAGALAGLAVSTKVYVAVLALPVPLVVWAAAGDRKRAAILRCAAGGLIGLGPGLALNAWLFGAPWVTGYERQLSVSAGAVGVADHSSRFTVPPAAGLRTLLFSDDSVHPGFVLTCPVWALWPLAAGVLLARPGGRAWVLAAAGVAVANLGLFAVYDGAMNGWTLANRYLFPALVCGLALIGAAAGRLAGTGDGPAGATRDAGSAGGADGSRRAGPGVGSG